MAAVLYLAIVPTMGSESNSGFLYCRPVIDASDDESLKNLDERECKVQKKGRQPSNFVCVIDLETKDPGTHKGKIQGHLSFKMPLYLQSRDELHYV